MRNDGTRSSTALGVSAAAGAAAGAAIGAFAGPPGMLAGAVIGAIAGAASAVARTGDLIDRELHDAKLDEEIGVTRGSLGAAPIALPPRRVTEEPGQVAQGAGFG